MPRGVSVSGNGEFVVFLRSTGPEDPVDALWVFDVAQGVERLVADPRELMDTDHAGLPAAERALRERLRLSAGGIGSFALDSDGVVVTFALAGRLFRVEVPRGDVIEIPTAGPVVDPRPDPTGTRVAYVTAGGLHVVEPDPSHPGIWSDTALAAEDGITWGLADFIGAEEFRRFRGYWWAPNGGTVLAARVDDSRVPRWHLHDPATPQTEPTTVAYPSAGSDNAKVTLHLLDLAGGWVDVHWDRETYPYLVSVNWVGPQPLITVLRRAQHHGLVLAVDQRTGETRVHAELSDPRWVEPIPGTPLPLVDGRVVVGGDLSREAHDARCLFADGSLITPTHLYARRLVGTTYSGRGVDLVLEASESEPGEQHVYLVPLSAPGTTPTARRLTSQAGWHQASVAGATLVVGSLSMDHAGWNYQVYRGGAVIGSIVSHAATPPYVPRPTFERVTDRQLPTGVLYPRGHVGGRGLPVLVDVYGGPGHQEVIAARARWIERQWWADQGFAVVVVDNRGTPGVTPGFEKAIYGRLADVVLADQVDALLALADKHPDLDLSRVAVRGWSFGGWLAGLAVLRRPDIYHVAVAGAPVTDWSLYDTAYTERYLGLPSEAPEVYAHNNLVEMAGEPPLRPEEARPILLVHGLVDDNVFAVHTLRLSAAMLLAGRPHALIPLTGATHMAAGGLSERLLRLELDFIRRNLPS
jgi:dipeptidyl-peptidase-4